MGSSDPFAACTLCPLDEVFLPPPLFPELESEAKSVWPLIQDPFEGSQLSGFSLTAVGSALAGCYGGEAPEEKERALWSLVRAGGGHKDLPHS